MDESTDVSDPVQVLLFVRGVSYGFKITEEFTVHSTENTVTRGDLVL